MTNSIIKQRSSSSTGQLMNMVTMISVRINNNMICLAQPCYKLTSANVKLALVYQLLASLHTY